MVASAMVYYPVFLDLRGREVLVAGGGKVALRKVKGLVEAGAIVTVVAPALEPEFETMPVTLRRRRFRGGDLKSQALVFAATDDRRVNQSIGRAAAAKAIPCNVADAPAECSFLVPARVRRGDLQIAVSTGGTSPRLAKSLRMRLESMLEPLS